MSKEFEVRRETVIPGTPEQIFAAVTRETAAWMFPVEEIPAVGALGPEWTFVGAGDYSGTGQFSFLIENTIGAVDTGTVVNSKAQYAQVAGLGSEWSFRG